MGTADDVCPKLHLHTLYRLIHLGSTVENSSTAESVGVRKVFNMTDMQVR